MSDGSHPAFSLPRCLAKVCLFAFVALIFLAFPGENSSTVRASFAAQSQSPQSQTQSSASTSAAPLPRGKKLILKDGSYQLVREYQISGDRVRYYSLESRSWEEMPESLVDWDATRMAAETEAKQDKATLEKVHAQEEARKVMPLDIDASLEAAPGVFLPPGEGLFAFDGKGVKPLSQALADAKLNKGRLVEQVLVPVPIIPSRKTVSIPGARARLRVTNTQPEFYMRTADAREPEMELIRARVVHDDERQIENIDTIFKQSFEKKNALSMQRWQLAIGVYRFTLAQPLAPGEYAIAENVRREGMNFYVWDFGVDAGVPPGSANPSQKSPQQH
jgi:hypothetical protein